MFKANSFESPTLKPDKSDKSPYSDPIPRKSKSIAGPFPRTPTPNRATFVGDIEKDYSSYCFLTNLAPKTLRDEDASLSQDDSGQILPKAPATKELYSPHHKPKAPYLILYNREMTRGKSPQLETEQRFIDSLSEDLEDLNISVVKTLVKQAQQNNYSFKQAMIELAHEMRHNPNQDLWDDFKHYTSLYGHLTENELTKGLLAFNHLKKLEVKDINFILKLLAPNLMCMAKMNLLKTLRQVKSVHWKLEPNPENPNQYLMVNSEDKSQKKPLTEHSYQIVIIHNPQDNSYTTLIGRGYHYQIAQKEKLVAFAGNLIADQQGHIVSINDLSGAYHSRPEESPAIRRKKSMSIPQVLFAAGLPGDKFQCAFPQEVIPLHPKERLNRNHSHLSI